MSIQEEVGKVGPSGKPGQISPREIMLKYLPFLPWVVLSIVAFMLAGYVFLRYSQNIYLINGTILVRDPNPYASKADKFDEVLFTQPNKNLFDEIQVIQSHAMSRRVVKSMHLEILCYNQGKILNSLVHPKDCPFELKVISLADSNAAFNLAVEVIDGSKFRINDGGPLIPFGQPFAMGLGQFVMERKSVGFDHFVTNKFIIAYAPTDERASELTEKLVASKSGESLNIMKLDFEFSNPKLGVDIVNSWMYEYQHSGLEDKRLIAARALDFINDQLDTVRIELLAMEGKLQDFRERNKVYDPEQQSQTYFKSMSSLDEEILKSGVQLQKIDNLLRYIGDTHSPYRKIGSLLGIEEPTLLQQMGEFNQLQVQRETLLQTTTEKNPMVVEVESSIEKLRTGIIENLKNVRGSYDSGLKILTAKNGTAMQEVSRIPAKEKELLDLTRQQKIRQELYSYLLQKKLETQIGSASTISNVRVIEPAMSTFYPVKPNHKGIYLGAFLLGILVPAAIIFMIQFFNDKVKGRDDVLRATATPVIGEVSHSDAKIPLVVTQNNRKFIAEQFRIIRTNMQYVVHSNSKPVILVTSSFSGEGKSFVSTNIGAVMSLSGKKTAVLEFDLRKPKIMSDLGLKYKSGITNYIIGKATFEELPVQVPGVENLFVIPCGPTPPNPSELLLDPRMGELMARLKQEFDAIVIDTAPVGLVSDAIVQGQYADATIYIVRCNYTYKKQLELVEELYQKKRLPNLMVVINDIIPTSSGYSRIYGYKSYGYGSNTYGYSSDYFEDGGKKKQKKSLLSRIFGKS